MREQSIIVVLTISLQQPLTSTFRNTMLQTDYLVIGAGAASLAFIDTLLEEQPAANIIVVDKHASPGGHWNDAYDFVRLHQPSLLYGVASKQMEGNWAKLLLKGTLPWTHRASREEILAYYQALVNKWVASGQVSYFPKCIYDFEKSSTESNMHCFSTLDGSQTYNVKVQVKLVNGILGECRVPSTTPPTFAVDDSITILTPNQVYEKLNETSPRRGVCSLLVLLPTRKSMLFSEQERRPWIPSSISNETALMQVIFHGSFPMMFGSFVEQVPAHLGHGAKPCSKRIWTPMQRHYT